MIPALLLCLVGLCTAGTILEYKDDEKGIHHVQSGDPGVQVAGMFSFNAPEGDMYNLAYTAGQQGFVANGDHLPAVPQDTEDVAAARSSFMEAFMRAEEEAAKMSAELSADEKMAADMSMNNNLDVLEVEAVRRRRSPVTKLMNNIPSYTYAYANSVPLTYPFVRTQPITYTAPINYHTYPATYAVQYPYYTYPTMQEVAVKSEEPVSMGADSDDMSEVLPVVHHPIVRIGFQGLQPVHVPAQAVEIKPVEVGHVQVANERTIQEGDDEPAALAL